jgi:hypothetical protein
LTRKRHHPEIDVVVEPGNVVPLPDDFPLGNPPADVWQKILEELRHFGYPETSEDEYILRGAASL